MLDTALLVMDCQVGVLAGYGPGDDGLIERLRDVSETVRREGGLVVHVATRFRAGHPEIADTNQMLAEVKRTGWLTEDDPASLIHPVLAGQADAVVSKRRVSAFAGTDLGTILRSRRIERLVLGGVSTSGVVLSTVRAAADLDYSLVVLADGCHDPDPAVHDLLVRRVFPAQATVTDSEAFARTGLSRHPELSS